MNDQTFKQMLEEYISTNSKRPIELHVNYPDALEVSMLLRVSPSADEKGNIHYISTLYPGLEVIYHNTVQEKWYLV